jgi:mono/diheme cytochrome c family protein
MIRSIHKRVFQLIFALLALHAGRAVAQDEGLAFYEAQVKPILQEHCLKCHGGGKTKGGLDLSWRTGVLKGGDQGAAVELEAPGKSLLLDMLSYRDEDHEMPPTGKLDAAQIAVLADWVTRELPMPDTPPAMAPAAEHKSPYNNTVNDETRNWWSYKPVVRPAAPAVSDPTWSENPIDTFVYARLAGAGLSPAPEARREALIRRVTYDLTGLPPTPQEVDAFLADAAPDAYEKLVDRLLASPHHGEKWGRAWLDVVRYAETNGYERDNPKPYIWRYRDYVVNALNKDKPYDRFIREQIAGDELPDGGSEGIVATGYYRLGLWDDEPVDKLQGRYDVLDGVVATTGEAFLGMTMGCARCHDHKIDPLPQKDYYKLLAFFDNVTNMHTTDITRQIVEEADAKAYAEAADKRAQEIAQADRRVRTLEEMFLAGLRKADPVALPEFHPSDMSGMQYRFYRDTWDKLPDFDNTKAETTGTLPNNFFDLGERTRNEAFGFVFEASLHVPVEGEYTFYLDSDDGARLSIDGKPVLEYDGVHTVGAEKEARVPLTEGVYAIRLDYFQRAAELGLKVSWSGPLFTRRALSNDRPGVDLPKLIEERGASAVHGLFPEWYRQAVDIAAKLRKDEIPGAKYAACIKELGNTPPKTFVHFRGNPNVPGDEVQPGFPEVLGVPDPKLPTPQADAQTTLRRSVLADWIASPTNPLTARVMMNRVWQGHFGRGLVRTPNDFGQAGNKPTHPELLDWLSAEFVEGGWTLKRMHKMLVLSRAYRMSSQFNEQAYAKDPANDLFWRFDMRRLTAEEVRDSVLALNGSINMAMGGDSVYPPMPKEVLETSSQPDKAWKSSPAGAVHAAQPLHPPEAFAARAPADGLRPGGHGLELPGSLCDDTAAPSTEPDEQPVRGRRGAQACGPPGT